MNKFSHLLISLTVSLIMGAVPLSSVHAENINIYGWQNWSYEFVTAENSQNGSDRDFDRLSNNAANIGFMSHMETGIPGLQVGFRCEQFTYWGRLNQYTNWCNRNSKISLRHERFGELMFGQWLLPFNEIVAQWVDPFYDAGADSHTSLMGNLGAQSVLGISGLSALFYNGSFHNSSDFTRDYGVLSFNRRQEGVVQYVWPNTTDMASQTREGFQARFAVTEGGGSLGDGIDSTRTIHDNIDPRIWSVGFSYQKPFADGSQVWFAVAYEHHEDVSAGDLIATGGFWENGVRATSAADDGWVWSESCGDSEDDGVRIAGRYTHQWGNGQSSMIAGMWEWLQYEISECEAARVDQDGNIVAGPWNTAPGVDAQGNSIPVLDLGVDRDAVMISGKHVFGNGFDFRFSYMDADELDCDANTCTHRYEDDTDAKAINYGLFYALPAGTELRMTYSEVQNKNNAQYDFGINNGGVAQGEDVSMFAIGIVHWFD